MRARRWLRSASNPMSRTLRADVGDINRHCWTSRARASPQRARAKATRGDGPRVSQRMGLGHHRGGPRVSQAVGLRASEAVGLGYHERWPCVSHPRARSSGRATTFDRSSAKRTRSSVPLTIGRTSSRCLTIAHSIVRSQYLALDEAIAFGGAYLRAGMVQDPRLPQRRSGRLVDAAAKYDKIARVYKV